MSKPKTERYFNQERVTAILGLASRRATSQEEYNQLAEKLNTTPYTNLGYQRFEGRYEGIPHTIHDVPPSTIYSLPFLYARNWHNAYPEKVPERSGKWLIFQKIGQPLDDLWEQVKAALWAGKLGNVAKVSTRYPNPRAFKKDEGVICVYTYNFDDEADRLRIREALKEECDVTWKIGWKPDKNVGRYAVKGDTNLLWDRR